MDAFHQLEIELSGIKDVIMSYASHGNISNFLNGLEVGIQNRNITDINYFLNEICIWYGDNIEEINTNEYVDNIYDHQRNKGLLEKLRDELLLYTILENATIDRKVNGKQTVLLSHKSSDKKYGDALEKLICGLGVKNNQLIYTSHPLHKIPLDANIYDYLRSHIDSNVFVIILWSNEYLESPACLNEMGAAWVVQSDYSNIYTPIFSFGNPKYHECAVDTRKMGAVLKPDAHCKAAMIELKNKILKLFNITIDEQTWTYLLDQFIAEISGGK